MDEYGTQTNTHTHTHIPINFYIRKQRGTLRHYFETEKAELLEEVIPIGPPARAPNKVLWWK